MIAEEIRFILVAALLIFGLVCFGSAVIGAWKFGFLLNRMHAAGIGDTLGLLSVIAAMAVYSGFGMECVKLLIIAVFLWLTSPVSSHFLSQIEYYTNPSLYSHVAREVEAADLAGNPEAAAQTGETEAAELTGDAEAAVLSGGTEAAIQPGDTKAAAQPGGADEMPAHSSDPAGGSQVHAATAQTGTDLRPAGEERG